MKKNKNRYKKRYPGRRHRAPGSDTGPTTGKYRGDKRGIGFLIRENKPHILIKREHRSGALDGDIVIVNIDSKRRGKLRTGAVTEITQRANEEVTGILNLSKKGNGFVTSDNERLPQIRVKNEGFLPAAQSGQRVVVKITEFPPDNLKLEGEIIKILGILGERGTVINEIIHRHKIPVEFSGEAMTLANKIPREVSAGELADRLDLRNELTVTIDGEDAKDLDDAVSLAVLPDGNFRLGVHIADVSHYVKPGDAVDRDAYLRGTSVYLADRVIPMLPQCLSNGICSLHPNVDRLTLSVIMEIDSAGDVVNYDIKKTVINTNERMTYNTVTGILENGAEHAFSGLFDNMKNLAEILKEKRYRRGSIDFDLTESYITVDGDGNPINVGRRDLSISNRIIEEFMIIANETVAEHVYRLNKPLIYRIHQKPDDSDIEKFSKMVYNLGYTLAKTRDIHPRVLRDILTECKDTPHQKIISMLLLRSLKKAEYSGKNDGHFGLSSQCYCHFTSPIRRYPDLTVHRILKELTAQRLDEERQDFWNNYIVAAAKQCSETEVAAQKCERDVEDYFKALYMVQFIGEVFDATVSGVTSFGIFAELDNTVEGLVHISKMDDYFIYDEAQMSLTGKATNKIYKIGDNVKVRLVSVKPEMGQIDFELEE